MPSASRVTTPVAVDETYAAGDAYYAPPGHLPLVTAGTAVAKLIQFLETGSVPDGLFAPGVFADLSLPQWRVQAGTAEEILALRTAGHPCPGQVRVERIEQTGRGFTIEFEERWDSGGQRWYCREMIRADVAGDSIAELSIYCTGDWDEARQREHAGAVHLIRP